jgi:hypothetical protein
LVGGYFIHIISSLSFFVDLGLFSLKPLYKNPLLPYNLRNYFLPLKNYSRSPYSAKEAPLYGSALLFWEQH